MDYIFNGDEGLGSHESLTWWCCLPHIFFLNTQCFNLFHIARVKAQRPKSRSKPAKKGGKSKGIKKRAPKAQANGAAAAAVAPAKRTRKAKSAKKGTKKAAKKGGKRAVKKWEYDTSIAFIPDYIIII